MPNEPNPQENQAQVSDIAVFTANKQGKDYVIGDIHGRDDLFEMFLSDIQPHDRVFLVGDLADRGSNSLGVYRRLIRNQKDKTQPRIYTTMGNHELMLLNVLDQINSKADFVRLRMAKMNGNIWFRNGAETNVYMNGGDWLWNDPRLTYQDILEIKHFLRTCAPTIMSIQGDEKHHPFHVVHAGMPVELTDSELRKKIAAQDLQLTVEQKTYSMWARREGSEIKLKNSKERTHDSIPVYCGHTPGKGVRQASNHINLDMGTFFSNALCVVNHTDCTIKMYTTPTDLPAMKTLSFKKTTLLRNKKAEVAKAYSSIHAEMAVLKNKRELEGKILHNPNIADLDKFIQLKVFSSLGPKASIAEQKKAYLGFLEQLMPKMDDNKRVQFANYLVNQCNHLLAKEQGILRSVTHSQETRSFHIAMGLLLTSDTPGKSALAKLTKKGPTFFSATRHEKVFTETQQRDNTLRKQFYRYTAPA